MQTTTATCSKVFSFSLHSTELLPEHSQGPEVKTVSKTPGTSVLLRKSLQCFTASGGFQTTKRKPKSRGLNSLQQLFFPSKPGYSSFSLSIFQKNLYLHFYVTHITGPFCKTPHSISIILLQCGSQGISRVILLGTRYYLTLTDLLSALLFLEATKQQQWDVSGRCEIPSQAQSQQG